MQTKRKKVEVRSGNVEVTEINEANQGKKVNKKEGKAGELTKPDIPERQLPRFLGTPAMSSQDLSETSGPDHLLEP